MSWQRELAEYLTKVGCGSVAIQRLQKMCEGIVPLLPQTPLHFHVTDLIEPPNTRRHVNFWIFMQDYCSEFKDFLITDNFDVLSARKSLTHVEVTSSNFDYKVETDASTMQVVFLGDNDVRGELIATGNNCSNLLTITRKYLIPAIKG